MIAGNELFGALALAGLFLLILAIGELVRFAVPSKPEIARKSVHFLSGMAALSFPYIIRSHWLVLCLAAGFSALLIISRKMGLLQSIHGVERKSFGAFYLPFAIYVIFLLGSDKPVLYVVSILVMTVSDTLAALLGDRYGSIRYEVEGNIKTLEGSVVFFFVTFLCVHLSLLLMTPIDRLHSVLIALVIALLVTGFEAISITGSDNIFIPFGTYFILAKMTRQTEGATAGDLWTLLIMIAMTVAISLRSRLFKANGLIGMVLLNYAAWSLCGFFWFLPLLLGQILLYLLAFYFENKVTDGITGYQIKVLIYTALVPAVLIFTANTMRDPMLLYLPYLASIVGQIAIISYFFLSIMTEPASRPIGILKGSRIIMGITCAVTAALLISALPIALYLEQARAVSIVVVVAGAMVTVFVFHILLMRYDLMEKRLLRQQMRMLSVLAGVAAVFLGQSVLIW